MVWSPPEGPASPVNTSEHRRHWSFCNANIVIRGAVNHCQTWHPGSMEPLDMNMHVKSSHRGSILCRRFPRWSKEWHIVLSRMTGLVSLPVPAGVCRSLPVPIVWVSSVSCSSSRTFMHQAILPAVPNTDVRPSAWDRKGFFLRRRKTSKWPECIAAVKHSVHKINVLCSVFLNGKRRGVSPPSIICPLSCDCV